jgi:hypothetical protein
MTKRIRRSEKRIGELLIERGSLNPHQLETALSEQSERIPHACLGDILLEKSFVHEDALLEAFLHQYIFPYIPVDSYTIDAVTLDTVPAHIAHAYAIVPLEKSNHILTVGMANPVHYPVLQEIERLNNCVVIPCLAKPSHIRKVILHYYGYG